MFELIGTYNNLNLQNEEWNEIWSYIVKSDNEGFISDYEKLYADTYMGLLISERKVNYILYLLSNANENSFKYKFAFKEFCDFCAVSKGFIIQ